MKTKPTKALLAAAQGEPVKERPIPFSAPMVRALLAGTKTQTRRALAPELFVGGSALSEGLGPLVECGWRYVPSEVWGDQVLTQHPKTAQLAREYGRDVEPLYALAPEDVAAVNAARKERALKVLRRLDLCRCDHNEYCQHCFPVEFRPGGVWGGPNAE